MPPPDNERRLPSARAAAGTLISTSHYVAGQPTQLDLSVSPVHASAPETSAVAAIADPATRKLRQGQAAVALADIRAAGAVGMTVDQVNELHPEWDRGTLARRVTDLREAGHVHDTGARRLTRRGYPAVVWTAVEHADGAA